MVTQQQQSDCVQSSSAIEPTSADASAEGDYSTSDMRVVVMLMCYNVPIKETTRNGARVIFHFNLADTTCADLIKKCRSGIPVPVSDINNVFDQLARFHSIVHNQA